MTYPAMSGSELGFHPSVMALMEAAVRAATTDPRRKASNRLLNALEMLELPILDVSFRRFRMLAKTDQNICPNFRSKDPKGYAANSYLKPDVICCIGLMSKSL